MNLTAEEGARLASRINAAAGRVREVDVLLAPSFTALIEVHKQLRWSQIRLAGQNMSEHGSGAYTGEVSASMLLTSGCVAAILGHSERRTLFSEDLALIGRKVAAAVGAGLTPIICIGETLSQRDSGATESVLREQLKSAFSQLDPSTVPATPLLEKSLVVAYEPVWAIGSGRVATPEIAQSSHQFIREWLAANLDGKKAGAIRIIYGGSVNCDNAAAILSQPDVDGALVGGASLDADEFLKIIASAPGFVGSLHTVAHPSE